MRTDLGKLADMALRYPARSDSIQPFFSFKTQLAQSDSTVGIAICIEFLQSFRKLAFGTCRIVIAQMVESDASLRSMGF